MPPFFRIFPSPLPEEDGCKARATKGWCFIGLGVGATNELLWPTRSPRDGDLDKIHGQFFSGASSGDASLLTGVIVNLDPSFSGFG